MVYSEKEQTKDLSESNKILFSFYPTILFLIVSSQPVLQLLNKLLGRKEKDHPNIMIYIIQAIIFFLIIYGSMHIHI